MVTGPTHPNHAFPSSLETVLHSLIGSDFRVAVGAHSNRNLIAHWRISGLFIRALRTHGSTTLSTVMLKERERRGRGRREMKRVNERDTGTCMLKAEVQYIYLSNSNSLLGPHFLDVPEEGYATLLAGVSGPPLCRLLPLYVHVPHAHLTILATGEQFPRVRRVED